MDIIIDNEYRVTDTHVFFWKGFMSNFTQTRFSWAYGSPEPHEFLCTEQAFMWAKARFFKDEETANEILKVGDDPLSCKNWGRAVKNYDDKQWEMVRYDIMKIVNIQKYNCDKEMREKLLDPIFENKLFVEASPFDAIWGIKMGMNDPGVENSLNWKGRNLLGQIITEVRQIMKELYTPIPDVV